MSNMKILVADDHAIVRSMISAYLRSRRDVAAVHEASNGIEVVRRADELHPDVVLVDVRMPGKNGLDAAREIKAAHPSAKVFVMSNEESFRPMALEHHADAFIAKGRLKESLCELFAVEPVVAAA